MKFTLSLLCILCALAVSFGGPVARQQSAPQSSSDPLRFPEEKHLRNIKQLSFGGENAEAYFSKDGKKLIFQSTRDGYPCDQIFEMNLDGTGVRELSTGKGRTTCSYFFPNGKRYLYSSTHAAGACSRVQMPARRMGFVMTGAARGGCVAAKTEKTAISNPAEAGRHRKPS